MEFYSAEARVKDPLYPLQFMASDRFFNGQVNSQGIG